jgi:hypothetical protein
MFLETRLVALYLVQKPGNSSLAALVVAVGPVMSRKRGRPPEQLAEPLVQLSNAFQLEDGALLVSKASPLRGIYTVWHFSSDPARHGTSRHVTARRQLISRAGSCRTTKFVLILSLYGKIDLTGKRFLTLPYDAIRQENHFSCEP